jgi:hypothetical protein
MTRTLVWDKMNELAPKLIPLLTHKNNSTKVDFEVTYKVQPTVVLRVQTVSHYLPGHRISRKEHVALVQFLNQK